jgi:hypothetical protein
MCSYCNYGFVLAKVCFFMVYENYFVVDEDYFGCLWL